VPAGRLALCPRCLLEADTGELVASGSIELIEEIGQGGMGRVFRAIHRRLGRTVAVKFLPEQLAGDVEFQRRFEREARALAMLEHPHIIAVHDFGMESGRLYLVMEYAEGGTVASILPLPLDRALEIAVDIAGALDYAHARGVVHRDLKPANVLLDAGGRAKLTDFGIARFIGDVAPGWTVTAPERVLGTLHYMAPETLDGAAPAPAMDLFSLGVVLYEMVTGHVPVGDFEPLTIPLDAIVRRCLAPDPARRYGSARELQEALVAARRLAGRRPEAAGGPSGSASGAAPAPDPESSGAAPALEHAAGVPDSAPGSPTLADAAAARAGAEDLASLDPGERAGIRVVAIVLTVATALALFAVLKSVTPRVMGPGDVIPLVMLAPRELPDGRLLSPARFETWWILAAVAGMACAVAATGALQAHWRRRRLDAARRDVPVTESMAVLGLGIASCVLFAGRKTAESAGWLGPARYVPVVGGLVELAMVYCAWIVVLQAWRRARPLAAEWRLWVGIALALVPPACVLTTEILTWKP
jgi:serine/threonine-protein kinase